MKKHSHASRFIICACVISLFSAAASAENIQEIIRAVDSKQHSDTSAQKMIMHVYPSMASETGKREFVVSSVSQGDDDTFMVFEEPRTVKGMKILSKADDRWVHFPSTGRVRKIAGESKKQSVQGVGGDFSYEDLGGGTIEKDYRTSLIEETDTFYRIEGIPVQSDSAYTRVIFEIEKGSYRTLRIEYYTEKEGHLKDLVFKGFTMMGGKDIAQTMEMINHNKQSRTEVRIIEAEFDKPVDQKLFNPTRFFR